MANKRILVTFSNDVKKITIVHYCLKTIFSNRFQMKIYSVPLKPINTDTASAGWMNLL